MTGLEVAGTVVGILAVASGVVVAWRKLRPEMADIIVTSADKVSEMSLRFASQVGQENDALVAEIAQLRKEFDQYRRDVDSELSQLRAELRAEKAEKKDVKAENDRLRAQVSELEAEVGRLRAEVASLRGTNGG